GQNWNYLQNNAAKNSPLPYLTPETPVTLGAPVDFTGGVIVDQFAADDAWNFQPTAPVKGTEHSPVSFGDVREQTPADVGGDITIGTFNVLNYFTDLGEDEPGCRAYPDREGNPVATNYCDVRGAYSQAAFEKQEDKIVEAINTLDASVIALEEIEDSSDFGHDRDATLEHLVDVLNEAAGEAKWEYVPSPATIPAVGDDVIRTAFIYQPAEVTYVEGSAEILENGSFTNARAPFAANFAPADEVIAENEFIVIANHLKSKGGSGSGDNASPDAQGPAWATGGWNGDRTRQAEALVDFAAELQEKHGTDLVFLTGDMNSYSMETPVTTITDAGYEHLTAGGPEYSYLFGGTVGSLDHVFASPAAAEYVTGTDIWTINAYESIALEYSRDNYNVAQLYSPDVFRSSDHNPAIIGVQFREDEEPVEATGDVHVTYFDDDIVNNAYDEGEDLRSGLLYAQNADGDWFGTGAGADGTFTLAGLPEGEYQVFLPLPNPYVSNAVFDAADGSRLPFETSTRTEGATWIDPATGEHSTFTVVERLSAVGTVSVVEDETTAVEYGLSAISAQATVVESGSDQGAQDLAELEFVDGEDTYYAHWNESIQGFNALVEEGAGTAYFLDEHVGVTVAPAEGYEVVSVTAEENGAELEVTQGASTAAADPATYTVERGELSNKNARVTFEVEVAPVEVEPTLTLTPERLTETESLEGVAYEGQGFGDGPVRIEVIDEAGEATVIEEAAEVADGAFHGTIVYRDADGTVLAMPVGTYTVRVTEGSGEDARILESTFEVVADEGEEPGPTEPGETEPGETEPGETEPGETDPGATDPGQQPGDDGDGSGKGDGGFDGDGHEGGLAQTGADGSLVILLALGAVLVLAGAGVMIQRRRA
ncbi:MAG: ExeM/NucH family extracellular endonuclease, partial [Actinomycetaceae bacterium]